MAIVIQPRFYDISPGGAGGQWLPPDDSMPGALVFMARQSGTLSESSLQTQTDAYNTSETMALAFQPGDQGYWFFDTAGAVRVQDQTAFTTLISQT